MSLPYLRPHVLPHLLRACQHELDHLDGILIVDHAGLDELPSGVQALERPFHAERQRRAFERRVYTGEQLYF